MSLSPMDIVKQTGTTIIFEEFDSNKPDLITLLTKDEDELPIEKFRNLIMGEDSELVVKSFSEFEEKFSPIISIFYSTFEPSKTIWTNSKTTST